MFEHATFDTPNLLLKVMDPDDRALLLPLLTRVPLHREQVLIAANQPITHVHFLEGGIASIVSDKADGGRTEVGIFGLEGLSGMSILLEVDRTPHEVFVQVEGPSALRIEADVLREAMTRSATLRTLLLNYAQTMFVQSAACVASNANQRLEARLARWLLMCHDRVRGDEIALTHKFMAIMVGAQRTGVTVALHVLEGIGVIRSKRGLVIVLDRERLEDLAGDAYGEAEAEYRRLIAPFGGRLAG